MDPNFHRTVVLVVEHGDDGALGLVINRPSPIPAEQAIPELGDALDPEERLWVGGPVQSTSVVVVADFAGSELEAMPVRDDVGLVPPGSDLSEVATAVRRARPFLGGAYALLATMPADPSVN
jgi:putative transcriptional regulator